jgi:membrane-bound ClpP family serine protease
MQFLVPQFIDVESKIIGPISVRQFIILLSGVGLLFVGWKLLAFAVFVVEGIFVLILTTLFAFVKINTQPFHIFLLNLIQTGRRPRLKIWNKTITLSDIKKKEERKKKQEIIVHKKPLTASRLTKLSLLVDTGGVFQEEGALDNQTVQAVNKIPLEPDDQLKKP